MPALRVECPACHTSYTLDHLNIPFRPGTEATVVCVCAHELTVTLHPAPVRILGIPMGRRQVRTRIATAPRA